MDRREFLGVLGWLLSGCDASWAHAITTGDVGDMKLIEPLCTGFAGAPSGTVTIYLASTSTPATTYTGPNATGSSTGTAGVYTLDAQGSIVLYVNQRVDITVKTAGGATVRSFTVGDHAAVTRYQPSSGWTTTGGFTDVATVLDSIATSVGGTDAKTTTGRLLKDVVAKSVKVFSVLTYGAVGNGVADDTVAIQAAVTAAGNVTGNNGVVYFPPGSYIVSSGIVSTKIISLLGEPGLSSIRSTIQMTAPQFYMNGPSASTCEIRGLTFWAYLGAAPTTQPMVQVTQATVSFIECQFINNAGGPCILNNSATAFLRIRDTEFDLNHSTSLAVSGSTPYEFSAQRCSIYGSGSSPIFSASTFIDDCIFRTLVGTPVIATQGSITNCTFDAGNSSPTITLFSLGTNIAEGGNALIRSNGAHLVLSSVTGTLGGGTAACRSTSMRDFLNPTSAASLTPDPRVNGVEYANMTAAYTVNAPAAQWDGAEITIILRNISGGVAAITWNAIYIGVPSASLANVTATAARFVYYGVLGKWIGPGAQTAFAA